MKCDGCDGSAPLHRSRARDGDNQLTHHTRHMHGFSRSKSRSPYHQKILPRALRLISNQSTWPRNSPKPLTILDLSAYRVSSMSTISRLETLNLPPETPREDAECDTDKAGSGPLVAPFIGEVDGRTRAARHYRQALAEYVEDRGGAEVVSRAESDLCRRAAGVATLCSAFEAELVRGEPVNIDHYLASANTLSRLCSKLGLQRRARDVTPDLKSYLAAKAQDND